MLAALLLSTFAYAQVESLRPPATIPAGTQLSLETSGSGEATFYLVGPGRVVKREKVRLGSPIEIGPENLQVAGRYVVIACSGSCQSASFFVTPAAPEKVNLLAHPSRVPVREPDAVSGVALAFDRFHNLVLDPARVTFELTTEGAAPTTHDATTSNGMAWFRTASSSRAGAAQLVAKFNDLSTRRVVQQVANDPCHLRISAKAGPTGLEVQTDPVVDCAGNPVPDGTIVTISRTDAAGVSSVDAPLKKGVARALMTGHGPATITVASGLVMGNEVRVGGQ